MPDQPTADDREMDLRSDLELVGREIADEADSPPGGYLMVKRGRRRSDLERWRGALRRAIAAEAEAKRLRRRAKADEAQLARLRRIIDGLAARVASQSELLSRRAEGPGAELLAAVEALFPDEQWRAWEGARLTPLVVVELTCELSELLALRDAQRRARG